MEGLDTRSRGKRVLVIKQRLIYVNEDVSDLTFENWDPTENDSDFQ